MAGRTAAAAGPCWTCWVTSRMLCSVAVSGVMLPIVPDLHVQKEKRKRTGMERSGQTPSALRRAIWPVGSSTGGAPTAAAESHSCWTAAETYVGAGLLLYTFASACRTCANSTTPSYLAVSAGWPGSVGREGPALLFLSLPLAAARVEAWLEGLLLRLALAGPAGDLKDALLRRRLGCYVADCA